MPEGPAAPSVLRPYYELAVHQSFQIEWGVVQRLVIVVCLGRLGMLQCPWRKGRQFTHSPFALLQEQLVQRPMPLYRHVLGIVY